MPLTYTPRKFISHPYNTLFYAIETDHRTYGPKAIERILGEKVSGFDCSPSASSLSCSCSKEGLGRRKYPIARCRMSYWCWHLPGIDCKRRQDRKGDVGIASYRVWSTKSWCWEMGESDPNLRSACGQFPCFLSRLCVRLDRAEWVVIERNGCDARSRREWSSLLTDYMLLWTNGRRANFGCWNGCRGDFDTAEL